MCVGGSPAPDPQDAQGQAGGLAGAGHVGAGTRQAGWLEGLQGWRTSPDSILPRKRQCLGCGGRAGLGGVTAGLWKQSVHGQSLAVLGVLRVCQEVQRPTRWTEQAAAQGPHALSSLLQVAP